MSILSDARPSRSDRSAAVPYLWETVAIGTVAGAMGYLLHEWPPLRDHLVGVVVVVALLAASTLALGLLTTGARGSGDPLPRLLLLSSSGGAESRPLGSDDLDFCAALHVEALGHGFFTRLGPAFLRAYYRTFLDSPYAVAFVSEVSNQPVGFLVGVLDSRAHARWLLGHRGFSLGLRAAAGMALHPAAAVRFIRTRVGRYARAWRRHRRADGSSDRAGQGGAVVLSHLAVLPGARRIGAGKLLVGDLEATARQSGATQAVLTTLEGPAGAGDFYESLGWRPSIIRCTPDGHRMQEWTRDLVAQSSS